MTIVPKNWWISTLNKQYNKIVCLISMQLSARVTADRLSSKSFSLSLLPQTHFCFQCKIYFRLFFISILRTELDIDLISGRYYLWNGICFAWIIGLGIIIPDEFRERLRVGEICADLRKRVSIFFFSFLFFLRVATSSLVFLVDISLNWRLHGGSGLLLHS